MEISNIKENKENNQIDLSSAYFFFHIFMIFMSLYYCMLLTNWNVIDPNSTQPDLLGPSWSSFWIKATTILITFLLYVYVLLAPRLFPDREFDF